MALLIGALKVPFVVAANSVVAVTATIRNYNVSMVRRD